MTATVTPLLPIASLGPGRWLVPSNSRPEKVHIVVESEEQFEAGQLRAAMCEPCLDRAAETQLGML